PLVATTDGEGRYEIRGARKTKSYLLDVASDPATGHMACQVRAADTSEYEAIAADISVKKGVIVTGKVLDAATKKPLRGFPMIGVLSDNPFVKEYPEFDLALPLRGKETAEDGTFRVVTIPGRVLLVIGLRGDSATRNRYRPPGASGLEDKKDIDLFVARM